MKHASVASLVALGFLTIPALAAAQPKPTGAAPEAAPRGAADAAEPAAPNGADAKAPTAATDEEQPIAPAPGTPSGSFTPLPAWPEPGNDAAELKRQNAERPTEAAGKRGAQDVFAEDWWGHARPVLELHGNFRVRAELFYQFALGRVDLPQDAMWPQPADNYFTDIKRGTHGPALCTPDELGAGSNNSGTSANLGCKTGTQAGANMRFRLDPELHISDNLRVVSQIDLFDNLVLGSTPNEYQNTPSDTGGYAVAARSGYTPIGFNTATTSSPISGINSVRDSIQVKRAWAEYATPVGEVRFGRMPNHWGLGIYNNAGDGHDDNYQSTVDRIQFTTGVKPLDLYVTGAWDFVNEGATSDNLGINRGQPYDVAQLDDVSQYMLAVSRRKSRELTRLALARGEVVINAGLQVQYRHQLLANDASVTDGAAAGVCSGGANSLSCAPGMLQFTRRGATAWTPDLWVQLLYKKFRFEAEGVTIQGNMDNNGSANSNNTAANIGYKIRQYGIATEIEQRLVEDKLRLGFNFGWASGDSDAEGLAPPYNRAQSQHGDRTDSTFRFNPAYSIDLILYRNILTRVQGTYYFRPSASYDFLRDASGQKLGGGVAAIWSRASEFVQSPGHKHDLGVELNANVYFQSKDGARNDDPNKRGGFFTKLEYGVLFPMAGLGYTQNQLNSLNQNGMSGNTNVAQTVRWYMGVFF